MGKEADWSCRSTRSCSRYWPAPAAGGTWSCKRTEAGSGSSACSVVCATPCATAFPSCWSRRPRARETAERRTAPPAGHGRMTSRTLDAAVLDDRDGMGALDPGRALEQAGGLGRQLRRGYRTGRDAPGLPMGDGLRAIVVCGMGGSGVAGDVLRGLYADRIPVPIVVNKGYGLPVFAGPDTLVAALSFSGNTEETLSAYGEAVA